MRSLFFFSCGVWLVFFPSEENLTRVLDACTVVSFDGALVLVRLKPLASFCGFVNQFSIQHTVLPLSSSGRFFRLS
jgi:hypothetical protein